MHLGLGLVAHIGLRPPCTLLVVSEESETLMCIKAAHIAISFIEFDYP